MKAPMSVGKQTKLMVSGLTDPDRFRRYAALASISGHAFSADATWHHFFAMRKDPYAAIRVEVIRAIVDKNVCGNEADMVIHQYLEDEDLLVRSYAEWTRENRSGKNPRSEASLLEERLGWWESSWNVSRDDSWWSDWLTSKELFCTFHDKIEQNGRPILSLLGGTVFDYDSGSSSHVKVWMTGSEMLCGYTSRSEIDEEGAGSFATAIDYLRHSDPLELGNVLEEGFSYGAIYFAPAPAPVVKWAQAGDWAAMVRNWHLDGALN
jgi:hypothetical protein